MNKRPNVPFYSSGILPDLTTMKGGILSFHDDTSFPSGKFLVFLTSSSLQLQVASSK